MIPQEAFHYLPASAHSIQYKQTRLPVKNQYYHLDTKGDPKQILLVGGYWGLGPILTTVSELLSTDTNLTIHVCCGSNKELFDTLHSRFKDNQQVNIYGPLPDLINLYTKCGCVIGRPGISTILEAFTTKRKLFLMNGLPVAEEGNAKYALQNGYAELYSKKAFIFWLRSTLLSTK